MFTSVRRRNFRTQTPSSLRLVGQKAHLLLILLIAFGLPSKSFSTDMPKNSKTPSTQKSTVKEPIFEDESENGSYKIGEVQVHFPIEPKDKNLEKNLEKKIPVRLQNLAPKVAVAPKQAKTLPSNHTLQLEFYAEAQTGFPVYFGVLFPDQDQRSSALILKLFGPSSETANNEKAPRFKELAEYNLTANSAAPKKHRHLFPTYFATGFDLKSGVKGASIENSLTRNALLIGLSGSKGNLRAPFSATKTTLQSLRTFLGSQALLIVQAPSNTNVQQSSSGKSSALWTQSVDNWQKKWSSGNREAFADVFDDEFISEGRDKSSWLSHKESTTKNWTILPKISIKPLFSAALTLEKGNTLGKNEGLMWTIFEQDFYSSRKKDQGVKTMVWKTTGSSSKVLAEIWRPLDNQVRTQLPPLSLSSKNTKGSLKNARRMGLRRFAQKTSNPRLKRCAKNSSQPCEYPARSRRQAPKPR